METHKSSKIEKQLISFCIRTNNTKIGNLKVLADANNLDKNEFDRILIKTSLEKNTQLLWEIGLQCLEVLYFHTSEVEKSTGKNKLHKEITKSLIFLFENGNININLSSPNGCIKLKNEKSVDLLKSALLSEFKKHNSVIPMRYETGEKLLKSGEENEWIHEYLWDLCQHCMSEDEFYGCLGKLTDEIDDDMIESYIEYRNEIVENFDIEFLEWRLNDLEKKKEKGAPVKNTHTLYLLIRFIQLLQQNPSNRDFKLIYDYCRFFNFIPREITSGSQYIKSIYRKYSDLISNADRFMPLKPTESPYKEDLQF